MTAGDPVERFRADVVATLGRPIEPRDTIAIAVSGGPDSMALLALAATAWPEQVIAATVDHGLRAAAADEAAMVAAYCASFAASSSRASPAKAGAQSGDSGNEALPDVISTSATGPRPSPGKRGEDVLHTTLAPATPLPGSNIQANARTARYALLTRWAHAHRATILATAHHGDDQAETFLMRAARGSGVAGLASIRPKRMLDHGITLIRPLLTWRRADLRALAEAWRVPFVDDPSNASDRHDRTRFRALLTDTPWLDPAQLARAAGHLLEADGDLRAIEAWLLDTRSAPTTPGHVAIDVAGLPRELRRRLVRAGIARVRQNSESVGNIEALLNALDSGRSANQAGVLVSAIGEIWHFRPEPPRRGT